MMRWWWHRARWRRAMRVLDGDAAPDPRLHQETRSLRELSDWVRAAASPEPVSLPPFEAIWSGVVQRAQAPKRPPRFSGLRELLERRPVLVLGPIGAMLVAAILATIWWARPVPQSHECIVDSYEVESGTVLIDQDPDRPERPTVIWHETEG